MARAVALLQLSSSSVWQGRKHAVLTSKESKLESCYGASVALHVPVSVSSFLGICLFLSFQKEQLKASLAAKEREEGSRGPETVKVQLRSTLVSNQQLIVGSLC